MRRTILLTLIGLLFTSTAWAEKVAGLEFSISSDIDSRVKTEIQNAYDGAFKGNSKYELMDTKSTRAKLNPVVRGCFTNDCLMKAGETTKAKVGIRTKVSGQSQIYDWTVETYDLRNGKQLAARKGSCELCGQAEVGRTFKATVSGVLSETKLPSRSTNVAVKPKPDPEPDPVPDPVPSNVPAVKLVKIKISVEPPDADITFRDAVIGKGRAEVEVGPGNHEFMVKADNHRTVKELVVVGDSSPESMALRVHLPKKDAPPEAVEVATQGPIDKMDNRLIWGLGAAGTGAVFLGLGIWLTAVDGEPTCDDGSFEQCPDVYRTGAAGFITTFTGAVLLTGGAVLLTWDLLAGESNPQEANVRVAPAIVEGGGGIGVFGRF